MAHCAPGAAMRPEIVEAGEKLIRRYVVNAPHSRTKWVGGENRRNRPSHWLLSGQVFGRGRCNAIPPEYWIAGRRSAVAGRRSLVLLRSTHFTGERSRMRRRGIASRIPPQAGA